MRALIAAVLTGCVVLLGHPSYAAVPADEPQVTIERGTGFTDAQVREIRSLVKDAKIRIRVFALAELPPEAADSVEVHATHLAAEDKGGDPGVVLVFDPNTIPEYGGHEPGAAPQIRYALAVVDELDGTAQEKFVELVEMMATDTARQRFEERVAENLDSDLFERDREQPGTGTKVLRWIVLLGGLVLVGLFVLFRTRAIRSWWRRRRRTRGIEEATDTARTKSLADRAKDDVAAFGAAIDAEQMDEEDGLALWRLALDDYDQASRLLDRATGARDHEKVIEICARGRDRLDKAQG